MESGIHSLHARNLRDFPASKPSKVRCPQQLVVQHFQAKCQLVEALLCPTEPGEGPRHRGLSCHSGPVAYLCGPADLEQVEPVGVPVVDDVGQFPPLLLPAPRHGGQSS